MKFLEKIGEAILEIVLSFVMFLIGYKALELFGIYVDPDLALLVGSVMFIVLFVIIAVIINCIKSKNR